MWLPARAAEQCRTSTIDAGDTAHGFGVTGSQPVPDSPYVFPTFKSSAVEERVLEVISVVAGPTVAHVHHVARFEPLVVADRGDGMEIGRASCRGRAGDLT